MVLHFKFIETILYLITLVPSSSKLMQFSDSINLDIPIPHKFANSDSSPFISDTSSSDDKCCKIIYPPNPDTSLNDTSSYTTIIKPHDTNPSHTCTCHSLTALPFLLDLIRPITDISNRNFLSPFLVF